MSRKAKELLEPVANWPDEDLDRLEEAARQIEAWRAGVYEPSDEELRAIDEAIAELDRGEVATAQDIEAAFRSFRHT